MKKLELIFAAILLPLDYLALLVSGTLAYFLRFESFVTEIRPVVFEMSYRSFFKIMVLVALGWLIVYALNGLYSFKRQNLLSLISKIIVASSAATLLIVVAFFFNFQLFSSRLIIITSWLLSIIIVSLERIIIHYLKKLFYRRGLGERKVILIGANKNSQDIFKEFKNNPSLGFKVVQQFTGFNFNVQESLLNRLNNKEPIDDVILADANLSQEEKINLVNFCLNNQINYKYAASLLETKLINFEITAIAGVPLIEVKQTSLDGWGRILKRVFDLFFALLLIIILSPLLLIIGGAVMLSSSGPMFVKLDRIGYSGKTFKLYKFRSMIKNAHQLKSELMSYNERGDGPLFKMHNDPRITPLGKIIRRWSLDELLQLFNVLKGDMSLVGPRPHEPAEVAKYQINHKKLLFVKPGITGMAQVSGRSDLAWEEEVRLDTYYLENWSLNLDVQILLKTPKAIFSKRQAN